jgi:hypothetical protein
MLQQISWSEYFIFLGLGTVVYYGWWLVRYFPGLPSRRPGAASLPYTPPKNPLPPQLSSSKNQATPATVAETIPPIVSEHTLPPPSSEKPLLLPQLAAGLTTAITALFQKPLSEAEILEALHHLLTSDPHRKLKSTPYEEKINALLMRDVQKYSSASLDPAAITGLWQQ